MQKKAYNMVTLLYIVHCLLLQNWNPNKGNLKWNLEKLDKIGEHKTG